MPEIVPAKNVKGFENIYGNAIQRSSQYRHQEKYGIVSNEGWPDISEPDPEDRKDIIPN